MQVLLMLISCQQQDSSTKAGASAIDGNRQSEGAGLRVLTTIAPLYSYVKNITGDSASVQNLLPYGVGPHEYSLSPEDIQKINDAQIIITNGIKLEAWLGKVLDPENKMDGAHPDSKGRVIVNSSRGIEVINGDPHVWLSPKNAIVQVSNILDGLVRVDPANSEIYINNAARYTERLKTLHNEIETEIAAWPKKEFVTFHSAFLYFARDYGLKQVAVIQQRPEENPSPQRIANVIKTIRSLGIKAIFSEPQISPKIVKAIANDLNIQVYNLDTLESGALYPEWYEVRMRANLEVLKMVLSRPVMKSPGIHISPEAAPLGK